MRALGRVFSYVLLGLLWLASLTLLGVVAYVLYVAFVGLIGRVQTILIGVLFLAAYLPLIYLARRSSRGMTEEELYNKLYNTWLLRFLIRIRNRPWPWSIYGLGPGRDVERTRPSTDPPAGGPNTG